MSSAVAFLLVAVLAATLGSTVLWLGHRARESGPTDFQDQLRALAPRGDARTQEQPSGIVPIEPQADEER